jgi:hypothetical protein
MWRCNNVSGQSLERRKTVDAGFAAIQGIKLGGNLGDGVFGVIGRSRSCCFVFFFTTHPHGENLKRSDWGEWACQQRKRQKKWMMTWGTNVT